MTIIDRYLLRALVGPFVAGVAGSLVIVTFGNLLRAISLLAEGRVETALIAKWFVYRIPEDMQYVFPVGILLATLLVFGRLSRNGEVTALRAAGVSLARLTVPVAIFGAVVTVCVFFFLDGVVPPAMHTSQRIWAEKIRSHQQEQVYKENILLRTAPGELVYVRRYSLKTHEMQSVMLREYSPDGRRFVKSIAAPKAVHRGGNLWELENASVFIPAHEGSPGFRSLTRLPALTVPLGDGPAEFAAEARSPEEMSYATLLEQIRKLEDRGLANTLPLKVELYLKTSFPFCVLIFAVIGTTMGLTTARSGGFIGFGVSLTITFLYYMVMSLSASLGKTGVIHPLVAAWLQNVLFAVVAVWLVARLQAS
jgi:lipopolysaccharide export system permease protein